jgi:aminoglycoside phosphotransferase
MRPSEYYSQPDAPDPVLDPAVVLGLVRRHRPQAAEVTAVDETGGEARAYAIDDDIILKTQRPHRLRPRTSLEKEVFFLQQLAQEPGVVVPRVYGYGHEGGVEYICMSRIPGVAVRYASLDLAQRHDALHALGQMLHRIHAIDQQAFVDSPLMPGDRSREDLVARVRTQIELADAALRRDSVRWPLDRPFDTVADQLLSAIPAEVELRALHSNPGPPHAFVDPASGAFTGLIDFGDAYLSHSAFDLRTWPSLDDRRALLEGYQQEDTAPPGWLHVWSVVMALTELATIATNPDRRPEAAGALSTLLAGL